MVVDLGDGTYAVQFVKNGVKTFVRVDGDMPTWSWGALAYADQGAQGSMWTAVMEKAFAIFRRNTGSYGSIEGGWMSEAFTAVGRGNTSSYWQNSADSLMSWIQGELSKGRAVTYATTGNVAGGTPLIGGHAYTVDAVVMDGNGNLTLRLRNPWGVDGAGNDGYAGNIFRSTSPLTTTTPLPSDLAWSQASMMAPAVHSKESLSMVM
jgi:hypothetical protein